MGGALGLSGEGGLISLTRVQQQDTERKVSYASAIADMFDVS